MTDRERIAELLARAAMAHDDDRPDALAECFQQDGVMRIWTRARPEDVTSTSGRAAIAARTAAAQTRKRLPRKHVLGTSSTTELAPGHYRVRTYFQVLELPPDAPATTFCTGTYIDEVRIRGEVALLESRGIELDFSPPDLPGGTPNG